MSVENIPVGLTLEINLSPEAQSVIRKSQTAIFRSLSLVRRAVGSESFDAYIAKAQQVIVISNQIRLAANAARAAMLGAGPLGWFMFGLSVAEIGVSVVDALPNDEIDMELDAR